MDPVAARFYEGFTYLDLLPRLRRNRERVEAFYRGLPPLPPLPASRALVLVEDWCPDSVQAIPVLARLPLEARFFFRDENPDLAEAFRELSRWHGPPGAAKAFLREAKEEGLPPAERLRRYHEAFPRFAEAMLSEWRALLGGEG